MGSTEWLRTFVAACQTGSISEAARVRHLSQPAATGHIRLLEGAAGEALFVRRHSGVSPTDAGRRLFAEVAGPLDQLTGVLAGLDRGSLPIPRPPLRIGARPEVFAGLLVHRLDRLESPVTAVFDDDDVLLSALVRGELDVTVTATFPSRKSVVSVVAGHYEYALVAPPGFTGATPSLGDLGDFLEDRPWVCYSSDLPRTRRFWKEHLGRPFDARIRLIVPDLRVVLSAVEAGVGSSLLPTMVCGPAIARGSVVEVCPVGDLIEPRPLWLTTRTGWADRKDVVALASEPATT
jgi:DNA-binding transcriptional LysR family regulator